jgi:hypothetical protein
MLTCLGVLIHIRMDFKTNPDIFSSFGSTILVSDSFGRGDEDFKTIQ